ncbi:putative secreted protein [Corynebacterium pseudotuberculosis]|nr:putative secreted protein [Corynebacterium pseudotuberculosis]
METPLRLRLKKEGNITVMLPRSRILAVLGLGLGLAFIMWGVLAPRFLISDARLPLNLSHTTLTLRDEKATTRVVGKDLVVQAPVTRQFHMEILPPSDNVNATVRIGVTDMRESLQKDLDRLINATIWSYSIDRLSGAATSQATVADQLASPTRSVDIDGQWLKFPTNAEKTTYEVFDVTLRKTLPAVFAEEATKEGRTLYRYRQEIQPTNVAQLYQSVFNTTTLGNGEDAAPGYLFHSGTRDWWVDQKTGLIVDVEEKIDDYFGDAEGVKHEDVLTFNGKISEEQVSELLHQASSVSDGKIVRVINYVVLAVGVILTIVGAVGAFWPRKR